MRKRDDGPGFRDRLVNGPPLLLDGALGSELDRRGVDVSLPLWSAGALLTDPTALIAVHREYAEAGADIITTDTFRTQRRTFERAGVNESAAEFTAVAVHLARAAVSVAASPAFIGGSMGPLEDCYRPELVPDTTALEAEHAETARTLADAGVDLLMVETINTEREAMAAARAALATGLPVTVSLVCNAQGKMLSGEDPGKVAASLADIGVDAVLINCAPAPDLLRALERVSAATDVPSGGYGNVGHADEQGGWVNTDAVDPKSYARYAATWLDAGARIIGSCCGTTPSHTKALRVLINGRSGVFGKRT
ncbi:MAG: homocysteine S-methyltransferase family protein [Acidobacteriota bacterium]|jgi:S-methylmethionine-dependent homocysteine/selenocysteine methylase